MSILGTISANFAPLRIRNFRVYLIGQLISLVGTWLQVTAQGWVVWELTGSTVALGTVSMLNTLPLFLLAPWAGAWADRFDRRVLLIASQVAAMLLAFILALLVLTNSVQLGHIYVLSLLLGVITAIDSPAQQAFLGDLTGASDQIRKAINLNIMIVQISRMLGPAVAGLVVGLVGSGVAFFLNGLSFGTVVISLLMVRSMQAQSKTKGGEGALRGFREAARFILEQPRLRDALLFAGLATFLGISIVLNILPAVASEMLGGDATTLGALMSSSGAGALVGVVIFAPLIQSRRYIGRAIAGAAVLAGLCFCLLSLSEVLPLAMLALFGAGLAMPSVISTVIGILQISAPLTMRARVMGLFNMVSFGLQPLAALWIGWSAEHLGLHQAILLNALGLMLGAGLMMLRAPLRGWEFIIPASPIMPAPEAAIGD
jgi:MFS family permease